MNLLEASRNIFHIDMLSKSWQLFKIYVRLYKYSWIPYVRLKRCYYTNKLKSKIMLRKSPKSMRITMNNKIHIMCTFLIFQILNCKFAMS